MAKGRNAVTDAHVDRLLDSEWFEGSTAMPSMTYKTIYQDKFKLPPGWSMRLGINDEVIFDVDYAQAKASDIYRKMAESFRDELITRIFRGEDISKYFSSPNETMFQRDRQGAPQRERPKYAANQLYYSPGIGHELRAWDAAYQPTPDMIDAMYPPALDGSRRVMMGGKWVKVTVLAWTDSFGEIKDER